MSKTLLTYILPSTLSIAQFTEQLAAMVAIKVGGVSQVSRNYYDSFDWRLYHAGMVLEFNQSTLASTLSLQNIEYPQALMSAEMQTVPRFAAEFAEADFQTQLASLLAMRALLEMASITSQVTPVSVLNSDAKTILRLRLEEYGALPTRLVIQIIKGYDKDVMSIINQLRGQFALVPQKQSLLEQILALQGKVPGGYSAKLKLQFDPLLRADRAMHLIYTHLLTILQLNVAGCIHNIDSEFLHDFRVAVRCTRVGLGRIKKVFPKTLHEEFSRFFSWLGRVTGPVRDLDVYLLHFSHYQQLLPPSSRSHLEPLRELLQHKRQQAYAELALHLQSVHYQNSLVRWQAYLEAPLAEHPQAVQARWPVKKFADQHIWKMYRRVMQEAQGIDAESSATALHDLRKNMKKLRYLVEFFQSLYPRAEMKQALKILKSWLDSLGKLQDYDVQIQTLQQLREEMRLSATPQATILALGLLIQQLTEQKQAARMELNTGIKSFSRAKNHRHFTRLFAPQKHYQCLDEDDD